MELILQVMIMKHVIKFSEISVLQNRHLAYTNSLIG